MIHFPLDAIKLAQDKLNNHTIYGAVKTCDDLKVFMEHHAFPVWDFMSLVKCLQAQIVPTQFPWAPVSDPLVGRFINEIVLAEETDEGILEAGKTPNFISHYELYTYAMEEVGASSVAIKSFVAKAFDEGIEAAFNLNIAPNAAELFTRKTFDFIDSGKPHIVAAAFALGREHVIPGMFESLLKQMCIDEQMAPAFYYYLKRHIHLDSNIHGPVSLRMVEFFIQNDPIKKIEAVEAAISAINARIQFWDCVEECLPSNLSRAA